VKKEPVFNIPQTIKEDTKKYKSQVEAFLDGEIDPVRFKGYRVPMGVYGQRGEETEDKYMVRVRVPGGVITRSQLACLNELSKEYGSGYLHITTRQDIQIHQVNIEDTPKVLFKLLDNGLSPRGGGGNTVRNIMNSARAGVNPEEVFDTTPHNLALTEYLIRSRSSFNLPRKYKIAFSSVQGDDALATVNDLGFIAKELEGKKGFKVYGSGGMGNGSKVGLLLEEFIEEDKIFHVAEAIKRFFDDYGDRSNKHKARLRFVRERLGDEEFINKYKEYLDEVLEEGIETEEINYYQETREEVANKEAKALKEDVDYIYREKEDGYYSLELRPENGDLYYDEVEALLELLTDGEISIRTTNRQGILLRGIKSEDLDELINNINEINQKLLVANRGIAPISCKGASTCRLGLCISPNLTKEISKQLRKINDKCQKRLPQIYISGCPNVCGQHLIGKIGFEGKAKRIDGRLVPHYVLLLGGNVEEGSTRYGEKVIDIPAKRIPEFLVELAKFLESEEDYSRDNFDQYLAKEGKKKIVNLAENFTSIPDYEEDPQIYKDWGQDEDFSLAGRGAGECGVGVMDIIQLDLNTAKDAYEKAIETEDNDKLYQAIVNAARALLIVRGVDTNKDRVILKEFKEQFIEKKLVNTDYTELLDAALDYKLGDIDGLLECSEEINNLIERVDYLFKSLNAKLEFDLEESEKIEDNIEEEDSNNNLADLRGVKCPMNFVKTKIALAPLDEGDILEVYLDEGEPIKNVPQSLLNEGHEILAKEEQEEGYYSLVVKKG